MPPSRSSAVLRRASLVDLEHHRGDQLAALRDERIVGAQLVLDLLLAALFDVEHLMDLMPHRRIILEIEGGERADLDTARPLHLGHALAPLGTLLDVVGERHDVGAGQ